MNHKLQERILQPYSRLILLRMTVDTAIAHLSHCSSVRSFVCLSVPLFVTRVDQSKTVQARIIKSSPSDAWKTLVLETVELFHKFEEDHPKQGC